MDIMRHGGALSPGAEEIPSPGGRNKYPSESLDYSALDTPRKNKRKLSEPKRRSTDFSIKRFCPDSPGSACSESGRSEESGSDRTRGDTTPESPEGSADSLRFTPSDLDGVSSHLRPPMIFPSPYFLPHMYYNPRLHGFPGGEALTMHGIPMGVNRLPGIPCTVDSNSVSGLNSVSQSSNRPNEVSGENIVSNQDSSSCVNHDRTSQILSNSLTNDDDDQDSASEEYCKDGKKSRKNYKNMTRERRVEANARERTRVHTISAAFEGLRRAVPSYSYNQKLSKLAILRIACSYIGALSKLTDDDEPESLKDTSFSECVDNCTRTIQTEGKARRRH